MTDSTANATIQDGTAMPEQPTMFEVNGEKLTLKNFKLVT